MLLILHPSFDFAFTMNSSAANEAGELAWRRLHRASKELSEALFVFTMQQYGEYALEDAWFEFTGYAEDAPAFSFEDPQMRVFMPWFLHHWVPDPADAKNYSARVRRLSPAQAYLKQQSNALDTVRRRYLDACLAGRFGFHEIVAVEPGQGMLLRDVFTQAQVQVIEKSGSAKARVDDILFAKVISVDGVALLDGCSPIAMPPLFKPELIDLREVLEEEHGPLRESKLRALLPSLLDLYREFMLRTQHPALPKLQNTDGEPLLFHTLRFAIDSPPAAFAALKSLSVTRDEASLLAEAKRDASGALVQFEIPWEKADNALHKSWTNTLLGRLEVMDTTLTAEVNSAARAQRIRDLIEERLGAAVRHVATTIEAPESKLQNLPEPSPEALAQQAALNADPQVQAQLAAHLRDHYREWVDTPLPMLDGRTPREAVRDPNDRERIMAVVAQLEREVQQGSMPITAETAQELRSTLGLDADADMGGTAPAESPEEKTLPSYSEKYLAALDPAALVALMESDEDRVPRNVIDACARHGAAMVQALRAVARRAEDADMSSGQWWLRLHACMILGLIPGEEAGMLLVQMLRRIDQDDALMDQVSGNWPAFFANKPHGIMPAVRALVEDETVDWSVRCEAMEVVTAAAERQGAAKLDAALAWLAGIAADRGEDDDVRLGAAGLLCDFPRPQYRELLDRLAKEQEGEPFVAEITADDVAEAYAGGRDAPQWRQFDNPWKFYDPATTRERQRRWAQDPEPDDEDWALADASGSAQNAPDPAPVETYVRAQPKVGRNDPCRCGSGKKYKQCCLLQEHR